MSDLRKWMNLMEGTYPEPPKADLSEPEAPMEDDPEFENEDGERSAVDHMAEAEVDSLDMTSDEVDQAFDDILKRFEDGDLEKWLKANDDATPPLELVVADIKLRGPDSLGLYIIDEDKLQELIEAGEIDEDMMHYFQNAQEELRIELAQFQKEMGESEEDPMLNDDGDLSPLSVDAEDVCEDSDLEEMLALAGVEAIAEDEFDGEEDEEEVSDEKMVDIGDVDDVLDAQDEIPSLDKEMGDAVQGSAPENVDELIQAIMDAQALGMSQAKAYYSDDMLINMSPERVKMAYSKVMGEGLEEAWSEDVYDMQYDKDADKVTGEVEIFGADRDGDERSLEVEFEYDVAKGELRILDDYHQLGSEIDAYFDDDDVHQQVQDEVAEYLLATGALQQEGNEFIGAKVDVEEGWSPDVYNMDYNEKTGDVVGDVEVFGGDQDGGEMSLDVEFEYDAATDEIKIHTDYHSEGLEIGAYFDDDDVHQQVRDEVHEFIDAVEKRRAGDVEEDQDINLHESSMSLEEFSSKVHTALSKTLDHYHHYYGDDIDGIEDAYKVYLQHGIDKASEELYPSIADQNGGQAPDDVYIDFDENVKDEFHVEEVEMEEDIAGVDPDVEAAILQLASALGLDSADQDDAEVIGKKLDVPASDVHKVINQDLTQESYK